MVPILISKIKLMFSVIERIKILRWEFPYSSLWKHYQFIKQKTKVTSLCTHKRTQSSLVALNTLRNMPLTYCVRHKDIWLMGKSTRFCKAQNGLIDRMLQHAQFCKGSCTDKQIYQNNLLQYQREYGVARKLCNKISKQLSCKEDCCSHRQQPSNWSSVMKLFFESSRITVDEIKRWNWSIFERFTR